MDRSWVCVSFCMSYGPPFINPDRVPELLRNAQERIDTGTDSFSTVRTAKEKHRFLAPVYLSDNYWTDSHFNGLLYTGIGALGLYASLWFCR